MDKILIYPFDEESLPIIRHSNLIKNIEIISLVSPSGWGLVDSEYTVGTRDIKVTEDFESALIDCSVLWIPDSKYELPVKKHILPKIVHAVKNNKKVLFTRICEEAENRLIKAAIPIDNQYLINFNPKSDDNYSMNSYYNINTPIISVCSLFEDLNKFETQLCLREGFLEMGYKILQIGSRQACEIFEFYSMPEFLFDKNYSVKEKIIMFNHFLKRKEMEENPDIIILGIPGDLQCYSNKKVGNFGVLAYEIYKTVFPDYTIMCIPYEEWFVKNRNHIRNHIENIYQIIIDCYNLVPKKVDTLELELFDKISYLTLSEKFIISKINEEVDNDIICILNENQTKKLMNKIISQLSSNTLIRNL